MPALLTVVQNPFDPLGSRRQAWIRKRVRVRTLAPRGRRPVIALLNGRPLLRAGWRRRLRSGDSLVFCVLPRDNRAGSNPLRMLLSIALLAFAPWAAGGMLTAAGVEAGAFLFGSFTYGMAATLGIHLVGAALINALLPMPEPATLPNPSPTYTLGAQGNAARIDQAIPAQYGRLLVYPDLAAQPYVEFAGNEQYLYQLFCLGLGEYDIEDIRIEDTPLSSFTEIETEIVAPGDQVTLFPSNVITSVEVSGQELQQLKTGTWAQAATVVTITEAAHGRATGQAVDLTFTTGGGPDGKYAIASVIDEDTWTVTAASGSGTGNVEIRSIVGGLDGFVAAGPGTVAHRLAVDLVYPLGLFSVGGGGEIGNVTVEVTIEARQIDDEGDPVGAWFVLGTESVTDRSTTPQRRTFFYDLAAPGRYQVRAWRLHPLHPSTGAGDQVIFSGLRSYLREVEDFGPVTMIAMRMRATNNLSQQASRKVAVLTTRKLPVWNGSTWSAPQTTRSIAWAIADAARNADYGAGMADGRVDLAALLALDAIWSARGDHFDGRFDSAGTWWDAASRIAAAGRARPFLQGGTLRVVRDGPDTLPVALFSMRNIKRGSFAVDFLMPSEDTADAVTVKYFDETTWTTRRVTAALPGSSAAKPAEIDLSRSVTDRAQALREAHYHAASNRYRRRVARLSTEMEGFIPSIGDLVAVQHVMPAWGAHAEAVSWNAGPRRLVLTEPLTFGEGSHYVGLRRPDGSVSGPWLVTPGSSDREIVLAEDPDFTPQTEAKKERTHVAFGPGQSWSVLAKVARVRPRGLYDVEIEAVIEDGAVHTAEEGVAPPPMRTSTLPGVVTRPVVTGLIARLMPGETTRAVLAWQPAPWADIYQIEMAEGDDPDDPDVSWTRADETTASHHVIDLLYANQTMVRVRGLGLAAGPWAATTLGSLIAFMWSADDATAMWTADPNPMWS